MQRVTGVFRFNPTIDAGGSRLLIPMKPATMLAKGYAPYTSPMASRSLKFEA
jgi:hypothetical protein